MFDLEGRLPLSVFIHWGRSLLDVLSAAYIAIVVLDCYDLVKKIVTLRLGVLQ